MHTQLLFRWRGRLISGDILDWRRVCQPLSTVDCGYQSSPFNHECNRMIPYTVHYTGRHFCDFLGVFLLARFLSSRISINHLQDGAYNSSVDRRMMISDPNELINLINRAGNFCFLWSNAQSFHESYLHPEE